MQALGLDAVGDVVQNGAATGRLVFLAHHAHAPDKVHGLARAGQKHGFDLVHRLPVVEVAELVEQLSLVVGMHHVGQSAGGQFGIGVAQLLLPGFIHEQKAVVGPQVLHQVLGVVKKVLQVGTVADQGRTGGRVSGQLAAGRPHAGYRAASFAHEARMPLHPVLPVVSPN